MNRRNERRTKMIGLVLWCSIFAARFAGSTGAPPPSSGQVPASLTGTWEVEHVGVDLADQMHWPMRPDDPTLRFRRLVIGPEEVRLSGSKLACKQTVWKPRPATWGQLFARGFLRSGGKKPVPSDFGFRVRKEEATKAYSLCPASGTIATFPQDVWVAPQGVDSLAMHFDTQVLLILKKIPPDSKPQASFDCAKATTPVEKTICGSLELASWDRSVAAAWSNLLRGRTAKHPQFHEEQKRWLRERDACGTNVACIEDHLARRVGELVEEDSAAGVED
jgi:uncharacterized protein YecT (DUF1311 family)